MKCCKYARYVPPPKNPGFFHGPLRGHTACDSPYTHGETCHKVREDCPFSKPSNHKYEWGVGMTWTNDITLD